MILKDLLSFCNQGMMMADIVVVASTIEAFFNFSKIPKSPKFVFAIFQKSPNFVFVLKISKLSKFVFKKIFFSKIHQILSKIFWYQNLFRGDRRETPLHALYLARVRAGRGYLPLLLRLPIHREKGHMTL